MKIEMFVGPLYSAVRQAAIVTSEESRGVDFTFGDGKVVLAGRAAEVGHRASSCRLPTMVRVVDHAGSALFQRFSQSARRRRKRSRWN